MKKITLLIVLLINSVVFAQQVVIQDFQAGGVIGGFGGGQAALAPNPSGTGQVAMLTSVVGGEVWQGVDISLTQNVRLTTDKTMSMDVYSTTPITIAPKVINGIAGAPASTTRVSHTGTGWETLTFTFNLGLDNTQTAEGDYGAFVIYYNYSATSNTFGTRDSRVFYVDNIRGVGIAPPVVFFPATAAPTPTTPNAQVFSIFGDTAGFTDVWAPNYSFGSVAGRPDLDPGTAVNTAIHMNFGNAGYGEGLNDNAPRKDVSSYGFINFDYYVKSGTDNAGTLGHQFYFDLISRIGANNTEAFYGFGPAISSTGNPSEHVKKVIVFDSWQTVSIPLSAFTGFSPANFFQFKLGSSSDLRTQRAFFDNIYFSVNAPVLGTSKFETSSVKMYPNPVQNTLTIEANSEIQRVSVYNVLGQEVMQSNPKSNAVTLQTNDLQKGVYMVTTEIDGNVSTSKVIKE